MRDDPFADLNESGWRESRHPNARWPWFAGLILTIVFLGAMGGWWLVFSSRGADPNAPRVEMTVFGMTCPIQCGLKVTHGLESLPWVVPDSVEVDPSRQWVRFAVTDLDAINRTELRRIIRSKGFTLGEVRTPRR